MKPKETFLGQPIRSLQTMLRVLAENDDAYKPLIPDGIYGPDTMEAVRIFQRLHRLPITGVTDLLTWEAVVEAYQLALVEITMPETVQVLLNPGQTVVFGEKDHAVSLAQVIWISLPKMPWRASSSSAACPSPGIWTAAPGSTWRCSIPWPPITL